MTIPVDPLRGALTDVGEIGFDDSTILRELLTWRYHEYANGFKSAAKDLVS